MTPPSQPHAGNNPPDLIGQAQTVYFTGENPTAILVTRTGDDYQEKKKRFKNALAALAWCQRHSAMFVWLPLKAALN